MSVQRRDSGNDRWKRLMVAAGIVLALIIPGGMSAMAKAGGGDFDPEQFHAVATLSLGPGGGVISISDTETPVDGVTVEVPDGALEDDDELTLGWIDSPVKVRAGTGSGIVLALRLEHAKEFFEPVRVTVPYDPALYTNLAIPYQVDDEGRLHLMDIAALDDQQHTLALYTFHPCAFTWVYP